ncbi:MAG: MFS transporter [Anaerolineales bacterium]|nr:MFS transporter [Anaerolineales bacterium]
MQRVKNLYAEFPRQFWIIFGGTLINSTGSSMVFPFITLYLRQRLNVSMTTVGMILMFWAISALVGQIVGGTFTDRFGRKRLMMFSLVSNAVMLSLFGLADSFALAAIVVSITGFVNALYQPARDAMIADLVASERRPQAYGLIRVVANLGVAIGPAIGGFLAAQSYLISFLCSASATFVYFLITTFLMRETKPDAPRVHAADTAPGNLMTVLRDTRFVVFCLGGIGCTILAAQMMTVLPVYMKDQFGLGETFFGWVMTTNAAMVVFLQLPITRVTRNVPRLMLTASGAILYALGVGGVALGNAFPHFIAAMIVFTFGEMILVPTSTAVTADLAPADLRGRYMGMLGLTWSVGFGIGPIVGGLISDQIAPIALWPLTATSGILAAIIFLALARRTPAHATAE